MPTTPNRYLGTSFAVGFVAGTGIVLLLLIIAVPEFSLLTFKNYARYVDPKDTLAQWSMATFSFVAVAISVFAVILISKTLTATRDTLKQAEATSKITKEAFHEDLRPYLSIDVKAEGPLNFSETEFSIEIRMNIKNHGKTPARSVSTVPSLVIIQPDGLDLMKVQATAFWIEQKNIRFRNPEKYGLSAGNFLFPEEVISYTQILRAKLDNSTPWMKAKTDFRLAIYLSSTYSRNENDYYQTGATFQISANPNSNIVATFTVPDHWDGTQENLIITKSVNLGVLN